eukprot:TRINITY_DN93928_c0_g1_i1.p1 TRINITY_DN93928_c0_g1~~TRINITY_DN93928_c0_g1_i1.p1  ORF type:complete len:138 (-),score=13.60 TRINITY_DN93928_c0_g1_i1:29-442(-)
MLFNKCCLHVNRVAPEVEVRPPAGLPPMIICEQHVQEVRGRGWVAEHMAAKGCLWPPTVPQTTIIPPAPLSDRSKLTASTLQAVSTASTETGPTAPPDRSKLAVPFPRAISSATTEVNSTSSRSTAPSVVSMTSDGH